MWLAPAIVTGPALEPVTLAEAKQFLRLDVDDVSFDTEVSAYIGSAREQIELLTGTRLISQVALVRVQRFEDIELLPIAPVQSVTHIRYLDPSRVLQTLPTPVYELVGSLYQWGILKLSEGWPAVRDEPGAIRVTLEVGYGDYPFDVPEDIRTTLLLAVRAMFDDRPYDLEPKLVNRRLWMAH